MTLNVTIICRRKFLIFIFSGIAIKDGFDIGDIGGVVSRVVTQLKNKFLEFDGIGSILAGGALAMGLKKIYSLTMQLKNAAMSMKNWYKGTSVSSTIPPNRTTGGVTSSVGSMVVHANSVVVNGKAVAQNGATSTTSRNGTSSTTTSRNTTSTTAASTASKLSGLAKAAGGTAVLTGIFSIMDLIATRSTNADRISEAQSVYDEAQEQYKLIAKDSKRSEELPSATEKLQKATSDLKAVQKEVVQHNNESLFGGGGAVAGAAAGAAVGSAILPGIGTLVGSILGGIGGSELGKELGKKFDYDVLGWLTGKNGKTSATTKADWKLDDGRMFSELSAKERIGYKESASEKIRRETSQNAVVQQVKDQKRDEYLESFKKGEVGDFALSKVKEEDIDAAVAASVRKKEQQRLGMNNAVVKQTPVVASMYGDKNSKEISNITNKNLLESFFEKIGKIVQNDSAVKQAAEKPKTESLSAVDVGNSGLNPVTGQMITLPTMPNFGLPDFNIGAKIQNEIDFVSNKFDELKNSLSEKWTNFNISDMLPDFNLSQWLSEKTSEMPDFSQMWSDFSVSDMLPDFNLSQWLSERTSELSSIDLTSMLPDFSTIGTSISETFSQIPTAASEAFNTISTYANDGLTTIQTAWNELPGFFGGLFSGFGEVASGAGTAIASGINSGIGMIQSAWESLSGWLSAKISSLSSMASSAAAKIGINIGHNATGTASWRGGFTEINEHGGEIIDLPSGTRIYPHATTMKMLQDEFKNGKLDGLIQSEEFNSLSKNFAQVGDLNFQAMSTFPPSDLSAFPQAFQFDRWANSVVDNSSSTTNNSNSSSNLNGVTVTGNTFNVRQESDINEIAFRLLSLITDEHANYAGA